MPISTAVDASAVASVLGIKTQYRDLREGNIVLLPQRVAVVGQGREGVTYSSDKIQLTSAAEVANRFGSGSPLHLAALQLMPPTGTGVGTVPVTFYPLQADGAGVAAVWSITPAGTPTENGTYRIRAGGYESVQFTIEVGDTVEERNTKIRDAINGTPDIPVTAASDATEVTVTAKWKGTSGNDATPSVVGPTDVGNTFAVAVETAGAANPSVQPALDQVGNVWETMVLNTLDIADTTNLDRYQTFGDGRWGALVHKPLMVFTGVNAATVAAATTVSGARGLDKINSQLVAPGSDELPVSIAARQLAQIVVMANNNPAHSYNGLYATGIQPGTDAEQWTYPQKDQAIKAGSSTVDVNDGVVTLQDIVTFYHPANDPLPAYRYVVTIVKLQNIIFNLRLIFASPEWEGAPLLPDDQPTANRTARKPKAAVAAVAAMAESLGLEAILADAEYTKTNTRAQINESNPNRLDLVVPVKLSGNVGIISIDLDFGFNFGQQLAVA